MKTKINPVVKLAFINMVLGAIVTVFNIVDLIVVNHILINTIGLICGLIGFFNGYFKYTYK